MSPTVPPISQIIKSKPDVLFFIKFLISLVTCGITCTVLPKYLPDLSLSSILE